MTAQTIFTIIMAMLVLIWLAQLVLLYVAAQNQGQDPYKIVSGAAIFFPVPLPVAQIAPTLVEAIGGIWESLVNGIFRGGGGSSAPTAGTTGPYPSQYDQPQPAGGSVARLLVDGQEIQLDLARTRLGRYPNNEVVIENSTVSAYHAEIIRRPDNRHEIVDRESRNGTRVNGALVRTQILKDGDLITLGGATLHYLNSPAPQQAPPEPYDAPPMGEQQSPPGGYPPEDPSRQPPPGGQRPPDDRDRYRG
ncbi:MAG: FHA domain-containing protein [Chloroflexota bacterium]